MFEALPNSPQEEKSLDQIKVEVAKVILAHKADLRDWDRITDELVATIKDELKAAMNIPMAEKIVVRVGKSGFSTVPRIEVETADSPPRRLLDAKYGFTKEMEVHFLEFAIKDITSATGESPLHAEANERAISKSLKDCMATLAENGRLRDAGARRVVEAAIRKELAFPAGFANRALLVSGKQNGTNIDITVEDKESEQVIAEIEYNTQFGEFASQKINKAIIRRLLKKE